MKKKREEKTTGKKARFIIEIPGEVDSTLKQEAAKEQRSRKAQVQRILEERYGFERDGSTEAATA